MNISYKVQSFERFVTLSIKFSQRKLSQETTRETGNVGRSNVLYTVIV